MSDTPIQRECVFPQAVLHSPAPQQVKMAVLLSLFFSLLCFTFTANSQEPPSAAVHVELPHLKNVSASVLAAENWLRTYVLPHYPSTNITTIVVGRNVLCRRDQHHNFGLLLPAVKNLHHSLTRWALHHQIKPAAAFSSDCLDPLSKSYRDDVAQSYIKPLLTFLEGVKSPYVVHPPQPALEKSHSNAMKNLGVSMIMSNVRRQLTHKVKNPNPFPPRPAPSIPTFALPPLVGTIPPQPNYHVPAPYISPMASPPLYGPHLPPCDPSRSVGVAPAPLPPHAHHVHGTWCVAKPSVPAETLQEALDYACGEGDVDCDAIKEDGNCYYPDTVVAHASYAFNSYWQKTKANGGTCGFGGTAMIITSDPSYGHCRFALS
ncbi:glucan endo-1,3-beta-glucosidase 12-like [Salvia splendens]|uniref:glucan endo-1,3-beta-glucosidase 12-like n=1 Tax=Salvia splendens TaxID=180675 RepID=UPI001C25AA2D|nr:glucan endo-1,3-beta-glucosidase 12-like [Salvia splendens]